MAIADKLNVGIKFDLLLLPYFFALSDNTDYGSEGISTSNVKGNFEITGPVGLIHNNTSWTTPDIVVATSNQFNSVNIPLSDNFPLIGTYTFKYTIQVSGGVQPGTYEKTFTVNFDYQRPVVSITYNNNPYTTTLTSTDTTQYLVNGVLPTKTLVYTLIYPPLYQIPDTVTNVGFIPVGSPYYLDGVYTTTVESTLLYLFNDYSVSDSISGSATITIADIVDIKSIFCCLDKLNTEICNLKSTPNSADYQGKVAVFNRANSLLTLMNEAVRLGQYTKADAYIQEIYAITGCTRGCTCGNLSTSIVQTILPVSETPTYEGFEIGDMKHTSRSVLTSNWRFAIGQLELISDYPALYSVCGASFNVGGEPVGYFRFPDSRGRTLIGAGQGTGLTNRVFGQQYGQESVNATHSHGVGDLVIADHTISIHQHTQSIDNALGIYTPVGSVSLSPYTPLGAVAITPFTVTGAVALSAYTPAGTLSIGSITVDFTNIDDHTDTIDEAGTGHNHSITTIDQYRVVSVEVNTPVAESTTYTTTDTVVSIDLSTQPLVHSGSQLIPITGTFSGTPSAQTATFTADQTSPIASFTGSASTQTASFSGTPDDLEHNHTISLTIDNHDDLVHVISGSTDPEVLIIPIIQPSLTVNVAIKVA